jgi:hypothetical protein
MTIHLAADALTDFSLEVFERLDGKSGEARRVAASRVGDNLTATTSRRDPHGALRRLGAFRKAVVRCRI